MAKHVSDRFEGVAIGDHSRRKAVAKDMRSFAGYIKSDRTDVTPNDLRQ